MATITYFISPHGLGHAARACACMNALWLIKPNIHFKLITGTPRWFYEESLDKQDYEIVEFQCDVGMVQANPIHEDIPASIKKLNEFINNWEEACLELESYCKGSTFIVSDITPIGLDIAQRLSIPSVLIENFTWDWIYKGYLEKEPEFKPIIEFLGAKFKLASYHIKTLPYCSKEENADLISNPVSRKTRQERQDIEKSLGLKKDEPYVLITLGGFSAQLEVPKCLKEVPFICVMPTDTIKVERIGSLILVPWNGSAYHPDLVYFAQGLVGKVGYSTIAEAWQGKTPFVHIPRPDFIESQKLCEYIEKEMRGFTITEEDYFQGKWIETWNKKSYDYLTQTEQNGADQIAEFLIKLL